MVIDLNGIIICTVGGMFCTMFKIMFAEIFLEHFWALLIFSCLNDYCYNNSQIVKNTLYKYITYIKVERICEINQPIYIEIS